MFPMGKVKEEDNTSVTYRQNVSIPDGKGKARKNAKRIC